MNKKIIVALLFAVVLGLGVVPTQADVGTSTLSAVTPGNVAEGATLDFTFTVAWAPADSEYLSRFNVTLPAEWTINSVAAPPPEDTFCTPPLGSGNTGQTVWWGEPPDGCGPWNNPSYDFSVNVTVTTCTGAPWDLPWLIEGDGWAAAPHTASGTYASVSCTPAAVAVPAMNIPHITDILIYSWEQVVAYGSPGGEPARLSNGAVIVLPQDYDGNGFDTYVVTDSTVIDGETWVSIFLGNESFAWVQLSQVHLAGPQP